ncbi:hypothetical protein JCM11641_001153 [Rhodosporidiobolus odoratus]
MTSLAPPPRRTASSTSSSPAPDATTKTSWKDKAGVWTRKAFDKGTVISDKIGVHANNLSAKFGGEAFWPVSGDYATEVEKCTRILRAFTVDGVVQKAKEGEAKQGLKKQGKVYFKIPAAILRDAKGIVIYASNRMGSAPFGGSGGSGLILARLPDGSWSAPSAIAPGNFAAGLMFGIDIFEAVLVIRTQEALESFYRHQVTLGAEVAVAAGHYGTGGIAEAGKDRTAVYSYVRSRGFYVGAEAIAQLWFCRFDENEREFGCTGVTQEEILKGHFRPTPNSQPLFHALREAETGLAQRAHGAEYEFSQPFETKDAGLADEAPATASPTSAHPAEARAPGVELFAIPAVEPNGHSLAEESGAQVEKGPSPAFLAGLGAPPALPARQVAAKGRADGSLEAQSGGGRSCI